MTDFTPLSLDAGTYANEAQMASALVDAAALSEADRAMLLAAWFPGYLVSQIPGAALIEKIGPKLVMGGNMLGTCRLWQCPSQYRLLPRQP